MSAPSPKILPLWAGLFVMVAGMGGPIGFAVLIVALPHLQQVAPPAGLQRPPPETLILYNAVISATHWSRAIVTAGEAEGGVYAANYRTANDPQQEDEALRLYRRYPAGAIITKHHFATLADAKAWKDEEFITRMVRTDVGHGPDQDPWRYERIAADGQHEVEGFADQPQVRALCAGCHANAQKRDFIFTTHLGDD